MSQEREGEGEGSVRTCESRESEVMQITNHCSLPDKNSLPRFGPRDGGKQKVPVDLGINLEGRSAGALAGVTGGTS